MILKASKIKSTRHAGALAKHLERTDENERAEIIEIRGSARPDSLEASLKSMQRASNLTQGKQGLYHVAINPRSKEGVEMTDEQWKKSIEAVEKEFKLESQPRVIVEHQKQGRKHIHVVWQLTDTEKKKLIDISQDYPKLNRIGRELEKELHHQITPQERMGNSYSIQEQQLAKRTNENINRRRELFRNDWGRSKDSDEFRDRLQRRGYTIAEGDRAKYVAVTKKGDVLNLSRELGVKTKEIGERFQSLSKPLQQAREVQTNYRVIEDKVKELNKNNDDERDIGYEREIGREIGRSY